MTIKYKYIPHTYTKNPTQYYIKTNIKSIEAFKKWFLEHHFNATIVDAYQCYNDFLQTEIKDLKNFSTFKK